MAYNNLHSASEILVMADSNISCKVEVLTWNTKWNYYIYDFIHVIKMHNNSNVLN